jgi:NTP pyrophosphatase (non-canonical NTP hydrolase)
MTPMPHDGPEHFEGPTPQQFSADVTGGNYAEYAERTECDYALMNNTLDANDLAPTYIGGALAGSAYIGHVMDALKGFLFYGKGVDPTSLRLWAEAAGIKNSSEVAARLKDPKIQRLIHVGSGLQTEASEFNEALLLHIFEGKPLDEVNLQEELGDVCWYVGIGCRVLNCTLIQLGQQNIAKLYKRFKGKFTQERVLNRDLEGERQVLEDLQ